MRGLDAANLDRSVSPCNDFNAFANGGWKKANPIPGEFSCYGSFEQLSEVNLLVLRELCEAAALCSPAATLPERLVGTFYKAALDEAAIERAGLSPVQPLLSLVETACSLGCDVAASLGQLHAFGVHALFGLSDGPDPKRSSDNIAHLRQGGLGLPDRDYYTEPQHAEVRRSYEAHVAALLRLGGCSAGDAAVGASAVLSLESQLAAAHLTRTERRDPVRTHNPTCLSDLVDSAPQNWDWALYFGSASKVPCEGVVINTDNPEALAVAIGLAVGCPRAALRAYLRYHVLNSAAEYLPPPFADADFEFYHRVLSGQKEQKPRWKRAIAKVTAHLPDALGQLFVERCFPGDSKARALAVVAAATEAMAARLATVPWMGADTRAQALAKLRLFRTKVGFPDEWTDYSSLALPPPDGAGGGSYFACALAARRFDHARTVVRIDAPVDRSRWLMAPQVVNAYFHPLLNEIVFPAAILQPPFFDRDADDAVNFGAMGAVVGHEITHGYDDQGRKYDEAGNLHDWWSEADAAEFTRRVAVQAAQASAWVVHTAAPCEGDGPFRLGGGASAATCACKTVNGDLTLGENTPAHAEPDADGFTPIQRFFLSWAQVWRCNSTREAAALRLATDPHGPPELRVNGPLSNMGEFHAAFGVGPGDRMWRDPKDRVEVW